MRTAPAIGATLILRLRPVMADPLECFMPLIDNPLGLKRQKNEMRESVWKRAAAAEAERTADRTGPMGPAPAKGSPAPLATQQFRYRIEMP